MSYTIGQLVSCPTIQRELNDYFMTCPVREFMPFWEFANSAVNNRGLRQEVSPGGGKVRTVRLIYTPRQLESSVQSNVTNPTCNVTNFIGDNYTDYTIDTEENEWFGFSMTWQELQYACIENRRYFMERLNDAIDVIDRALASKHTPEVVALAGNWASNVQVTNDELVVNTKNSAALGGFYNPDAVGDIDFALQKSGFCSETMIFAGNDLATYYRNGTAAGCCSNQGINVEGMFNAYGKAVAYDRRIELALGTDGAIAVQAGSLSVLTFNAAPWTTGMDPNLVGMGNEVFVQIVSPRTGIPMDLLVKYDCGKVHVGLAATTKLVSLPNDLYRQGDFMEGVNYIAKIDISNPA